MDEKYDFQKLENKWRPYWSSIDLYKTGTEVDKPNYYILDYFPYPSGDGLSVGHCRNYVPTCVSARFKRKRGFNVLHPMGWDAFGLPAENYAIDHGTHPAITSARHCATYRRQMKLVECSFSEQNYVIHVIKHHYPPVKVQRNQAATTCLKFLIKPTQFMVSVLGYRKTAAL